MQKSFLFFLDYEGKCLPNKIKIFYFIINDRCNKILVGI